MATEYVSFETVRTYHGIWQRSSGAITCWRLTLVELSMHVRRACQQSWPC